MGGGRVTVTWSLGTAAAVSHRNEMMEDSFSTNLALWSVLRAVHPRVVEAAVAPRHLAVLPVGVVEVGHAPSVLLVLVVVSIGRPVLGGRNGLGVRCRSTVVEVDLGPVDSVGTWLSKLLLAKTALPSSTSHADHPDEEDQQDEEDDGSSNAWSGKSSMKYLGSVLYCIGLLCFLTSSDVSKL